MHRADFGDRDPYFGRTGVHRGSAVVLLDRVLVSSYRLSIVTMPLTAVVWPQFSMHVFGVQLVAPFEGNGEL